MLKKSIIILIFSLVFIIPLILQYIHLGVFFSANEYSVNADINNLADIKKYFFEKSLKNLNLLTNPLIYFFFITLIVQKFCSWINNL